MRLAHVFALIYCVLPACSTALKSDDGASTGDGDGDGDLDERSYALCDGSDDVRLAVGSGGGFVDWSYNFTNPYGHRALFVTGKCEFLTVTSVIGQLRHGTLSASQAAHIEAALQLDGVADWPEYTDESCPDAGSTSIKTRTGYGECSCGCDEQGPAAVATAIAATDDLLDEFALEGDVLSGPVEVLVVESPDTDSEATAWTLSFDPVEVAITVDDAYVLTEDWPAIVVEGADAAAARSLRDAASNTPGVHVRTDDGRYYQVYVRDQVDPALDAAIQAFR